MSEANSVFWEKPSKTIAFRARRRGKLTSCDCDSVERRNGRSDESMRRLSMLNLSQEADVSQERANSGVENDVRPRRRAIEPPVITVVLSFPETAQFGRRRAASQRQSACNKCGSRQRQEGLHGLAQSRHWRGLTGHGARFVEGLASNPAQIRSSASPLHRRQLGMQTPEAGLTQGWEPGTDQRLHGFGFAAHRTRFNETRCSIGRRCVASARHDMMRLRGDIEESQRSPWPRRR
jgi:hypothetical protein